MVKFVLLPGMDGTGTLFTNFVHALGDDADVTVIAYPSDEPLGYSALVVRHPPFCGKKLMDFLV